MKKYKNCQSCGMPFSKDAKDGGTEKNGEKSTRYCSHCYENGAFTLPHITVDGMKQIVENKIVSFGFPRFLSKFFTRSIHKLERWSGTPNKTKRL